MTMNGNTWILKKSLPLACEVLAGLAFGLESGTDFTAGISGVILVHNVAERGKIIKMCIRDRY